MKTFELAAQLIKKHEGFSSSCYLCPAGFLTIGFGRMIDKKKGGKITQEEAEYLLANDLIAVNIQLKSIFPWFEKLNESRQAALIDLTYNIGIGSLQGFKKFLHAMDEKRYDVAAAELLDSKYAVDVKSRAVTISKIIKTGEI